MPFIPTIDGAAVLQTSVTVTATTNSTALDLGLGFDASDSIGQLICGVVEVTAGTFASHTYNYRLQESADGTTNWRDVSPSVAATAIGVVVVKAIVVQRFIRLVMTATGATPSISHNANVGIL